MIPNRNCLSKTIIYITLLCSIFLFILQNEAEETKNPLINCDIQNSSCTASVGETQINLDIKPKPVRAMENLTFIIKVSGKQPTSQPFIDLGMPGMHMGPNKVTLKSTGTIQYRGEGVIVRCPSGKRTWYAKITLPGIGETKFIFDVIY